jgi:enediyne biosynthesis protein E4
MSCGAESNRPILPESFVTVRSPYPVRLKASFVLLNLLLCLGCNQTTEEKKTTNTLFRILDSSATGISFSNDLTYSEQLNPYVFRNFYNGGGVGVGDINNDGLVDIFFAGNLVSNKLYLNKGNLTFKDITAESGIGELGVWTTGVSMMDINSDGLLDIYLCKSGPPQGARRHNELFINNGDLTFTEKAREYGLATTGLSTHAAFFDFDKDGDLDCYMLNNSMRSVGGFDLRKNQRDIPDPAGGNRLYRNDDNKFVDVSQSAGIYSSAIGFGLGVTIGDVNLDGWQDIYVSNDFFEKDYLYINNHDGTFKESIESSMREISLGSMGADMADINNDAYPEIFVTEMLPDSDERLKTTSQFEHWNKYRMNVKEGYYHQFSRNVLQLNNGDGTFSEIARLAGVHATDWSWGALIFDMDNDGLKDIFVANGIYKDLLNQDYVNFIANPTAVREILSKKGDVIRQLVDSIPSNKISNYAFHNEGNFAFANSAAAWGLDVPSHSNGSAYGDLDNDGDQDLVINNINMEAFVIENRTNELKKANWLSLCLHGVGENTFALGAKVVAKAGGQTYYQELAPMRGFMSTVDTRLLFGIGENAVVDTLTVTWPDDRQTTLFGVNVNQQINIRQDSASAVAEGRSNGKQKPVFKPVGVPGLAFLHNENDYSDFDRDRLLFNMISNEGPCLCKGDVNNDGREDVFVGGAKGQAGALFIQDSRGGYKAIAQDVFESDKESEDTDCIFFDANGDSLDDIYVTSGGSEFSSLSSALADRLYLSGRDGKMIKSPQVLPIITRFESTSVVEAGDIDKDGDLDLFVGARLRPGQYGLPADGFILVNDGHGVFSDATRTIAPSLQKIGMITDAKFADINNDEKIDLVITGEWMPIEILLNENGKFINHTKEYGLNASNGWYNVIEVSDFNGDGFTDIVAGNHGMNSRFKASADEPVNLYVSDFDQNGSVEQIVTRYDNGTPFPLVLRQDLITQIPSLKKKYLYFKNYKGQTITDIFSEQQLDNATVLSAFDFESSLWLNNAGKSFQKRKLPVQAQFSPVYAILPDDLDHDGKIDLVLGGNLNRAKPETGIYSASYGLMLKGNGNGEFTAVSSTRSGICLKGEVRSIMNVTNGNSKLVVFGMNNEPLQILTEQKKK